MSEDEDLLDDGDLLLEIGQAVAAVDNRLVAVENAVLARPGRRARRLGSRPPTVWAPALRRGGTAGRRDADGITFSIWSFDHLAPADQATALTRVRGFVDWLNEAYELTASTYGIAACWYRHPGVIRELWALLGSYQHDFGADRVSPRRSRDGPAYWHDRLLWPTLRRLREEHGLRECIASGHTPRVVGATLVTDDGFADEVERLQGRDE
ncbi:hypothetical protein [Micromonospora nigra]|uniref:hypothetical protein n=1 Tax=Micromonospora nigra TaxID=145857 RepID=UPI000AA26BA2|nr:hypothetical protein [Micromonospora nigra]